MLKTPPLPPSETLSPDARNTTYEYPLSTPYIRKISPFSNQSSLIAPHPLILCLACALQGMYPLNVKIRGWFDSCYPQWNDINARLIFQNSFQNNIRRSKYFRFRSENKSAAVTVSYFATDMMSTY